MGLGPTLVATLALLATSSSSEPIPERDPSHHPALFVFGPPMRSDLSLVRTLTIGSSENLRNAAQPAATAADVLPQDGGERAKAARGAEPSQCRKAG